jgi:RimJ/RimL family protein N-acetyltransferase
MKSISSNIPIQLNTKRLILRPYRKGDGNSFFEMVENGNREYLREILGYITDTKDVQKIESWLQELASDWDNRNRFVLSYWEKITNKILGHIWIEPINWKIPLYEIGWFIEKNQQSQGYVTEAIKKALEFIFKYLEAHKVVAKIREYGPYYIKSKNVAERCGFIKEGHLRDSVKLEDGSFVSELYYGILKEDYDKIY